MASSSKLAEQYARDRYAFTHGRCVVCRFVVAWPSGPRRRLKDSPRCPGCDGLLVRTCAALVRQDHRTIVRTIRFGIGPRLPAYLADVHAGAAGELCRDSGRGVCRSCGVALTTCETCRGVGYHREDCAEGRGSVYA